MADGLPAMRLKDIVRIDNARAVGLPSNSLMEPSTARASTNKGSNIIWFRLTCEVASFCMCSQSFRAVLTGMGKCFSIALRIQK